MPWTEAQLQEGRAFIEGWRQEGLDIDLAKLTYSAEFGSLPEDLEAHGWRTTEKTLVELLATVGLAGRRRVTPHDLAVTPRYVTATLGDR